MSDIQIPDEYKQKSRHIEQLWELFLETGENLDRVILETRNFLEELGFSRTDAMNKIIQDHKHLKGFSRATLYRMLPKEEKREYTPPPTPIVKEQMSQNETYEIPQPAPNIVDVEVEEPVEPIIQQEQRRTPEAPDNSMVEQLNHINIKLKKELEDLQELMDIRMADKDKRIQALVNDVLNYEKAIQLLKDENSQLKAELARHRRLEELRLEAQRKAINQWNQPGHKP